MTELQIAIALLNCARDALEKDAVRITVTKQEVLDVATAIGDLLVKLELLLAA